ncbi:MAG TPA: hypothetical protein VLT57_06000 [Bryobacteraceae bacterium]|nr:hypothetical protein [Bryobacteraceae bacterium]
MSKFKSKKSKPQTAASNRAAIPCLILLLGGIALMCLLFYFFLQSAA